jgi:stearoyl-CoA desaturase (delta-9 desaturase)
MFFKKTISNTTKLLSIHAVAHVLVIHHLLFDNNVLGYWILSFLWWQFVAAFAISSGYHRYFSHQSFKANKWYEYVCQVLAVFANPGPVLSWAAGHRMHHRYSDTEKDPHSPAYKGFWKVYLSAWGYGTNIERKFLKRLIDNPSVLFFYKNYFKILLSIALILFLIDYNLFFYFMVVPIVLAFHGYGMVNAYTHRNGFPTNSWIANILTAGEGWHLNHHNDPGNCKIGKAWYQIDTGYFFIKHLIAKRY